MRKIISISEVVDLAKDWEEMWEVCATAEATFDEATSTLVVELDSTVRPPTEAKVLGRLLEDWLPHRELVREAVALDEALPAAKEVFHRWVKKVRRSIPSPVNP